MQPSHLRILSTKSSIYIYSFVDLQFVSFMFLYIRSISPLCLQLTLVGHATLSEHQKHNSIGVRRMASWASKRLWYDDGSSVVKGTTYIRD
ncbi:hypothetical protein L211DRAFT_836835 [Terfezia boudieri ATCC MYA-4762]|uniref:Uncharacterized protein n=1 Tax=Terfezia boudieri ATCC MYA-4762 TaxID=1051890 RepID=A0A3N4LUV2_9PEZI|nr:hypothetical protein L211DRAFT_836835 [Terfezia boudieri ATCC MYA-4762]